MKNPATPLRLKTTVLLGCLVVVSATHAALQTTARTKTLFNDNWQFELSDDPHYRAHDCDDSNWRTLNLPHDWSIEGAFDPHAPSGGSGGFFPEGIGWYRKTFDLGEDLRHRQVTIQFDGVYMNSEVWINGHFLGRYPYGYSSFQYDLTEYLEFGDRNVLAVRVDNSLPKSTRWYNGSGIYRNAFLITTHYTHFHNYHGVSITTPAVHAGHATVQADYHILAMHFTEQEVIQGRKNKWDHTPRPHDCVLRSTVCDMQGREVARAEEAKVLHSFDKHIHLSQSVQVRHPRLWSAESPEMYVLKSELLYQGQVVDDVVTPFGIRKLEFLPNRGMFVNGKQVKLKGVCLHHEAGSLGAAVPLKMWRYRLQKLKAMGCNAIRTAHNPFAPEFYDLCDRMGFYVMDEAFDEWTRGWPWNFAEQNRGKADNGYHLHFDQWAETDLQAMIRRDRNHPSIVMYSIGNEVPDQKDTHGYKIAQKLVDVCHREDPTRPVTSGCDQYLDGVKNGFMDALDISGFNYVDRHYKEAMYSPEHKRRPDRLCVGTETSNSLRNFIAYRDNDYVLGQFIWVGQDYLGEARNPPTRGWRSGLIDIAGNPRTSYYRHKAYWSNKPTVHIAVKAEKGRERSIWNWPGQQSLSVTVYSNCDEVELFRNGTSLGRKAVDRDQYQTAWPVSYEPGRLTAVGYSDKRQACKHVLNSAGPAKRIVAKPVFNNLKADGQDIEILEISIVDEQGVVVPDAAMPVKLDIRGSGRVIGMDSSDMAYTGLFKASERKTHQGRLLAVIQTGSVPGKLAITMRSPGLAAVDLVLDVASPHAKQQPNILFLLADDMGYGELGCYGQKIIRTPHLDALAAQGMRFTDFYAACSVCSPSRAALMTGQHTGHVSIRGNQGLHENGQWGRVPLRRDEATLGEMLQGAGYQTAFIGKWHLDTPDDESTWALNRGFDYAVQEQWGNSSEGRSFDGKVHWIRGTDESLYYDQDAHDCIDQFRTHFALEYLDQKIPDKPFFLFMSYRIPHAHEFYIRDKQMYAGHGWPDVERRHAARITMLDAQIKRLLNRLDASGDLDNTVVFYTSDNGPHRENKHDHEFFQSSGGLRGFKRDLYEGGVRMPFIAYWKDRIKSGTVSHHVGAAYDLMPTLADLVGIKAPKQTDGISLLPTLLGKSQAQHDYLYWEIQLVRRQRAGFRQAVRMGPWKGVRGLDANPITDSQKIKESGDVIPITELYDLGVDRGEQHNVAAQHPDIVQRIEQIFREASVNTAYFPYSGQP